jgi:heme/copper-type cytochrome/quinol oxidase subunit 1
MRFRLSSAVRGSKTVRLHSFAFALLAAAGLLITVFLQVRPVDIFYHDTYFVVAIGHLVLAAAALFGAFAVAWALFQALSRRSVHEPLGQAHFWLTLAGVLMSLIAVAVFSAGPQMGSEPGVGQAYVAMSAMLLTVCVQLLFPVALVLSWTRRSLA